MGSPRHHPAPGSNEEQHAWTDERLASECLKGNDAAWATLVDRYKALVYSVPSRFGLAPDAAKEVFQEVWLSLLSELSSIRDPRALPAWLAQTAWHKCMHWRRAQSRYVGMEVESGEQAPLPSEWLVDLQQEQALRDSIALLPPRCVQLIRMLFFENPPIPYEEAADRLRLATGSISFIRKRCLDRLRTRLRERGIG